MLNLSRGTGQKRQSRPGPGGASGAAFLQKGLVFDPPSRFHAGRIGAAHGSPRDSAMGTRPSNKDEGDSSARDPMDELMPMFNYSDRWEKFQSQGPAALFLATNSYVDLGRVPCRQAPGYGGPPSLLYGKAFLPRKEVETRERSRKNTRKRGRGHGAARKKPRESE